MFNTNFKSANPHPLPWQCLQKITYNLALFINSIILKSCQIEGITQG